MEIKDSREGVFFAALYCAHIVNTQVGFFRKVLLTKLPYQAVFTDIFADGLKPHHSTSYQRGIHTNSIGDTAIAITSYMEVANANSVDLFIELCYPFILKRCILRWKRSDSDLHWSQGMLRCPSRGCPREVKKLIASGVTDFLNGGMGGFDWMCARVVFDLKKSYLQIRNYLVIPYLTFNIAEPKYFDDIIYPEGFEKYHLAAIPARNRYLVDNAAYALCYVTHGWGGAAQTLERAQKKGLTIINLGERNNGEIIYEKHFHKETIEEIEKDRINFVEAIGEDAEQAPSFDES